MIAVTLIVAGGTVICNAAYGTDFEGPERHSLIAAGNGFVTALCIAGALGVIVTCWQMLRLAGAITSIARLLNNETACSNDCSSLSVLRVRRINELRSIVSERLDDRNLLRGTYEKQIEELKIQLQISQKREAHIKEIIYSLRDAVIVIDEFDKVLMANDPQSLIFPMHLVSMSRKVPSRSTTCHLHTRNETRRP